MVTLHHILLPGLTGCLGRAGSINSAPLPAPVVGLWRNACRRAIGTLRTKITEEIPAIVGQNYHLVGAVAPPPIGPIQIALHLMHPFIGAWRLVELPNGQLERAYRDPPFDHADLPEGSVVIPAELLAHRFVPERWMKEHIEDAWTDIRVHKPGTVGELVFNGYD
ncbi:MAG: hypothetical protein ACOYN0_12500 [Phycisphaerales bacterium]